MIAVPSFTILALNMTDSQNASVDVDHDAPQQYLPQDHGLVVVKQGSWLATANLTEQWIEVHCLDVLILVLAKEISDSSHAFIEACFIWEASIVVDNRDGEEILLR